MRPSKDWNPNEWLSYLDGWTWETLGTLTGRADMSREHFDAGKADAATMKRGEKVQR